MSVSEDTLDSGRETNGNEVTEIALLTKLKH